MTTIIQIQDEIIAKVLACNTGHIRRVRYGAYSRAVPKFMKMGFTKEQARQMFQDAIDVAELERAADYD